jgi:hypothetical protein
VSGVFGTEHDELLSQLERLELRWLSWGRVDGSFAETEVVDLATGIAGDSARGEQLVHDLLDANLLLDVGAAQPLLRTRFAESVRLFARNRQLLHSRDWRASAQLVNDFRVLARPRQFPRRNHPLPEVLERLAAQHQLSDAEQQALTGMLASEGGSLELSTFQVEATLRLRSALTSSATAATIVAAGTGSGKTKAFYLPALAHAASDRDTASWVRIVALYPRNELLKDQLAEALGQVEAIAAPGGPVLSIGTLFGPTVQSRSDLEEPRWRLQGWRTVAAGFECLYMRCPMRGCDANLLWPREAWERDEEILRCPVCGWQSRAGQIVLTRDSLGERPPHVLFTTTEMLNRGLADHDLRPIFVGRTAAQRPRMLLLDEVHTYGGVHGAHVALLLRRWQYALGRDRALHVVGLSATLEDPVEFMRTLTGIRDVDEIRPRDDDMVAASAEYALVLRGNPVSGTALLSTTIQTAFLAARLLESRELRERTGTSGSRVFAFTDNLDVTNRLYWDLKDAENNPRGPLAQLRAPQAGNELQARESDGQVWDLPQRLGWPLTAGDRLNVRRTSSQDVGVDAASDVIVATASLEVGFDDPLVGAVIQHKAPQHDAAFIQRKGRAGRSSEMRPWTLVVLSDYGRDRARYQAFESLFAPVLRARTLPVDNHHVIKQQAAYALLDWLTNRVPGLKARKDLTKRRSSGSTWLGRLQAEVAVVLRAVLDDPRRERELERYLQAALSLTAEQTTAAMWAPPRALMTSVVPTLLRRVDQNWASAAGTGTDRLVQDVPLPEHAPQTLFADLNLPEVTILIPNRQPDQPPQAEMMPVLRALSEFVPGNASRRFAVKAEWHWVPLPEADDSGALMSDVADWVGENREQVGELAVAGETQPRPLLRPWQIELQRPPREHHSSNARPRWSSVIDPPAPGWNVRFPSASASGLLDGLSFNTHSLGNEVRVDRGVTSVAAQDAEGVEQTVELVLDGNPVALGFTAETDAVRLRLNASNMPRFTDLPDAAQRAIRTSWFEQEVLSDPGLLSELSPFTCGWVTILYLAAVASVAIAEDAQSLAAAVTCVEEIGVERCMRRALTAVFVVEEHNESRGLERLHGALDNGDVIARITELGQRLCDPSPEALDAYTRAVTLSTAASALREAFQRIAPTFDVDGLVIDPASQDDSADHWDVWLTEADVGSGGTVEELRRNVGDDPTRLMRLLSSAIGPTDYEVIDTNVRRLLQLSREHEDVATAFAATREAHTALAETEAQRLLRAALRRHGVTADHGVISTLNFRVLRPGSTVETDDALTRALALWDQTETRLAIEFDARCIAYLMSRATTLTLEQVYSLLWPHGRDARAPGLEAYSRYATLARPERLVLAAALSSPTPTVAVGPSAREEARTYLASGGPICVAAPATDASVLQVFVTELLMEPIDVGSVSGYPRIIGAEHTAERTSVMLELPEAML